jgi:hypothetical protein
MEADYCGAYAEFSMTDLTMYVISVFNETGYCSRVWCGLIDPILGAVGEELIGDGEVINIQLSGEWIIIVKQYHKRGSTMHDSMRIHKDILAASDPIKAGYEWLVNSRVAEMDAVISQMETQLISHRNSREQLLASKDQVIMDLKVRFLDNF